MTKPTSESLGLRDIAAVAGSFDPARFARQLSSGDDRSAQLRLIAADCDEVEGRGSGQYWTMRTAARLATLRQLAQRPDRRVLLAELGDLLDDDDRLGQCLIAGLEGRDLAAMFHAVPASDTAARNAVHSAARLLADLGPDPGSPAAERAADRARRAEVQIRRLVGRGEALAALETAIPARMFGRENRYRELVAFAEGTERAEPGPPVRYLIVSGVGGVGKSAVVSRLVRRLRRRATSPAVVHLDFDRTALTAAEPLHWTFEATRQLGLFAAELDEPLRALRARSGEGAAFQSSSDAESLSDLDYRSLSGLGDVLAGWPGLSRGLVVVLDTFEEVALREDRLAARISQWLRDVATIARIGDLRVVVAGREIPVGIIGPATGELAGSIELGDLDPRAGARLLESIGVERGLARRAARVLGGNPLALKMFERFHRSEPDEAVAILGEAEASGETGRLQGELAIRFLQDRILNRIGDPEVRALARRGLVVRRVSPAVVRYVLAEPSELKIDDDAKAADLLDRLARHIWLVTRNPARPSEVNHRRDVRRMMLPGLLASLDAPAIHRRAVEFYLGPDSDLTGPAAATEAAYHRGFLDRDQALNATEAAGLLNALGGDWRDWPIAAQTWLLFSAGWHGYLSPAMIERLGSDERAVVARHTVKEALRTGDLTFSDESQALTASDGAVNLEALRLAFAQCRFDDIVGVADRLLLDYFASPSGFEQSLWADPDIHNAPPWIAVLAADASTATRPTARLVPAARRALADRLAQPVPGSTATVVAAGFLALIDPTCPGYPPAGTARIERAPQLHLTQAAARRLPPQKIEPVVLQRPDYLQVADWLAFVARSSDPDLQAAGKLVQGLTATGVPSLSDLDRVFAVMAERPLMVAGAGQLMALASMIPQLHVPARFAIEAAGAGAVLMATEKLARRQPLWPSNFRRTEVSLAVEVSPAAPVADQVQGRGSLPPTLVSSMVATADRLGVLPSLLRGIASVTDQEAASRLRAVARAYERTARRLTMPTHRHRT